MARKYRVGVLGLGHWYSAYRLGWSLAGYPRAELAAVACADEAKRDALWDSGIRRPRDPPCNRWPRASPRDRQGRNAGACSYGVLTSITHTSPRSSDMAKARRPAATLHPPDARPPPGNVISRSGAPPSSGMRQKVVPVESLLWV